jgi:PPOX class probable F420-dependent enzyme
MATMTSEEYHQFMMGKAHTGKLATVREDGRPHIAPIWFHMDGEVIVFMTGENTVKGRNIQRDPRVSLCVDDEKPPFAFAIIEGTIEIAHPTPAEFLDWSTRIAGRYMGAELASSYGKRNAVPSELLVRLTPTHIIREKGIAD